MEYKEMAKRIEKTWGFDVVTVQEKFYYEVWSVCARDGVIYAKARRIMRPLCDVDSFDKEYTPVSPKEYYDYRRKILKALEAAEKEQHIE